MNCKDARESMSAYALGILDPDEYPAIDEHLSGCQSCRNVLARELDTVAALALAAPPSPPSPEARQAFLKAVAAHPAPEAITPIPLTATRRPTRFSRWLLPTVSAAAALLIVAVGVLGVLLNRAIDDRNDARSMAQMLSMYVSSGGEVVTMKAQESTIYKYYKGQGSVLIAPGREPVVVVAGCPESGDTLTYWVWFEHDGERTRAGKLVVGEDGSGWLMLYPERPLNEFDSIGITVQMEGDTREDVLVAPLADESSEQA